MQLNPRICFRNRQCLSPSKLKEQNPSSHGRKPVSRKAPSALFPRYVSSRICWFDAKPGYGFAKDRMLEPQGRKPSHRRSGRSRNPVTLARPKGHASGNATFRLVRSSRQFPIFDGLFPCDGTLHWGVNFVTHQCVHSVPFGESLNQAPLMLPDALGEVGGNAHIRGAVPPAGEEIEV